MNTIKPVCLLLCSYHNYQRPLESFAEGQSWALHSTALPTPAPNATPLLTPSVTIRLAVVATGTGLHVIDLMPSVTCCSVPQGHGNNTVEELLSACSGVLGANPQSNSLP